VWFQSSSYGAGQAAQDHRAQILKCLYLLIATGLKF
jgi:hypothetical protein